MLRIIDSIIWLTSAVLVTMIGAGFWVKGRRRQGIWRLALNSISRERKEVSNLARLLVNPVYTQQLVRMLTSMAAVDGEIDLREKLLLEPFADDWNITIDQENLPLAESSSSRILETRQTLLTYLDTSPPHCQVEQLLDVLRLLVEVDESTSPSKK